MKNFSKIVSNEEQKSDIFVPPKFLEDYRISLFVPEVRSKSRNKTIDLRIVAYDQTEDFSMETCDIGPQILEEIGIFSFDKNGYPPNILKNNFMHKNYSVAFKNFGKEDARIKYEIVVGAFIDCEVFLNIDLNDTEIDSDMRFMLDLCSTLECNNIEIQKVFKKLKLLRDKQLQDRND